MTVSPRAHGGPPGEVLAGMPALVRMLVTQLALDHAAGLETAAFVSGYPGSPLGGLDLELARQRALLEAHGILHRPGLNEELAATAVFGSQVAAARPDRTRDGVLGVWYGKSPGLDRAADALRHGNAMGTSAQSGVVVLVGDDPACKSSTLASSSEGLLADLAMPVLHPGDIQDLLDLGRHAVALSRFSGLWTAMKIVSDVADGSSLVDIDPDRVQIVVPEGAQLAPRVPKLHQPFSTDMEREIVEQRLPRARLYGTANRLNRVVAGGSNAWLGVIASGHTYVNLVEAFALLGLALDDLDGLGVRLIQVRQMYPFDVAEVRGFAAGLDELFVVEERGRFLETHLRDALYGIPGAPAVTGKQEIGGTPLIPAWGALDADRIAGPLMRRLGTRIDNARMRPPSSARERITLPIVDARPAWFCSGCPHSTSTQVPSDTLVGTGIGCHALASRMDPARVGEVLSNTQMGGEGAQWVGAEPFLRERHFVQNIGDGTLAHSGWLAIRFAVAAGSNITFKILYNDAVAMTGGQHPLGTMPVPRMAAGLLAEGVARVIVTTEDRTRYRGVRMPAGVDVWDRSRVVEAQQVLAAMSGVTVLIHDQGCAAELRRARKRGLVPTPTQLVLVNERVCEGCGDCGQKSGCLSVQAVSTEFGPKVRIHQDSCNFDFSCVNGDCPSFTLVERADVRRKSAPAPESPEPVHSTVDGEFVIRLPGIGGTGVVTLARIIAEAAALDGYEMRGLDQTGMSQKAGPVVSDLRIMTVGEQRPARGSAGGVDLYLALDPVVALAPGYAAGLSPRTAIVGSSTWTAPGTLVGRPYESAAVSAQLQELLPAVDGATVSATWIDAEALSVALTGRASGANVLLLGYAYQLGVLPLAGTSIERAIEQHGVAVDANIAAFRWGRAVAADSSLQSSAESGDSALLPPQLRDRVEVLDVGEEVRALVHRRAADLVGYQDERYANRYLSTVETAAATGAADLVRTVAVNLHKLMAYKDEYEVARLHLAPEAGAAAAEIAGPGAQVTILLHPPLLRALGLRHKLRFGPRTRPLLRLLLRARRIRGGPLDIFGMAPIRRTERRLITEYEALAAELADRVEEIGVERAIELAGLPDMIRGYEDIKTASVQRYEAALAELKAIHGLG
jgi:indolepyruvate ferredoxin oxidoreductase